MPVSPARGGANVYRRRAANLVEDLECDGSRLAYRPRHEASTNVAGAALHMTIAPTAFSRLLCAIGSVANPLDAAPCLRRRAARPPLLPLRPRQVCLRCTRLAPGPLLQQCRAPRWDHHRLLATRRWRLTAAPTPATAGHVRWREREMTNQTELSRPRCGFPPSCARIAQRRPAGGRRIPQAGGRTACRRHARDARRHCHARDQGCAKVQSCRMQWQQAQRRIDQMSNAPSK